MLIYKATNTVNGKVYIGKSFDSVERRKVKHKSSALTSMSPTYFHKALRKYGWDNFEWEVIDTAKTPEELSDKEMYWISFYQSFGKGYNSNAGGDGQHGYTHSEETKRKMSAKHKGRPLSEAHRKKLSEVRMGRVFDEGTKAKISQAQKGKPRPKTTGEKSGRAKLKEENVIIIKKMLVQGVTQREIAAQFGVSKNNIGSIQRGETWAHVEVEGFTPTKRNTAATAGAGNINSNINEEIVREIKQALAEGTLNQRAIAKQYGVSEFIISKIKTGKSWAHVQI